MTCSYLCVEGIASYVVVSGNVYVWMVAWFLLLIGEEKEDRAFQEWKESANTDENVLFEESIISRSAALVIANYPS